MQDYKQFGKKESEELTKTGVFFLMQQLIQEWTAQYETAMASHDDDPSAMDIYDVQEERGLSFIHHYVTLLILHLISHCVLPSTRKV
jgi:hypothetical protein